MKAVSTRTPLISMTPGMPIRTIRVDVTGGEDAGAARTSSAETFAIGTAASNDLVLADPSVSRFHAELVRCPGGVSVVDHGSTNGTFIGPARIERVVVSAGAVIRLGCTTLRISDGDSVQVELHGADSLGELRGKSTIMRRLMARIQGVAHGNTPVLIQGESGTGKELIARAIHELGPRAERPLVTVDCGALSPNLIASELFGHERGAFTGADRRHIGAFERADGGTLFLDEVGELPLELQPILLGVLERRYIRRLGGTEETGVDVRIISATNRDLREEVNAGGFRLDLYYRLAVVTLTAPPLRDRADDIPLLIDEFLRQIGHQGGAAAAFSAAELESLARHRWPGNVRELRNMVEATLAMGEPPPLDVLDRSAGTEGDVIGSVLHMPYKEARGQLLHQFEERYLAQLLERVGGNVSQAAREARMDRSHLITMLQRHQLRRRA